MKTNRAQIVMVDDDVTTLSITKNALMNKYDIFTVASGEKLFQLLEKISPDLILLDVEMPDMDGYEVIKILKSSEKTASIPVIFLTGTETSDNEIKGLDLGAVDCIYKPFSWKLLLKRIEIHLLLQAQNRELKNYSDNLEEIISEKTQTVFELQNSIIKIIVELVENRNNTSGGHIERTQNYLQLLLKLLLDEKIYEKELSSWDTDLFIMSSKLHDIGKISIRDDILMKPGKLTDEEFEQVKKHAAFGREIIEKIEDYTKESDFLKHAKLLAGSHHEKWDGSGYPCGLKGEEIPLQARLMAIVDVYDVMLHDRPYKKAMSHESVIEIIKNEMQDHFDPLIRDVFIEHEKEFKKIGDYYQ